MVGFPHMHFKKKQRIQKKRSFYSFTADVLVLLLL